MTMTAKKPDEMAPYLAPTGFIDSDHPAVREFAEEAVAGLENDVDRAVALYLAVRDAILYDPYSVVLDPDYYVASNVVTAGRGFCIPKAILLTAAARAVGIPARVGFADVRNHLSTKRLLELAETDLFRYHGYVELWLDGRWVKCTPAFNLSLCEKFRVLPLDFDGRTDSMFHPFDADGRKHMEYVHDHGTFTDVPFEEIAREIGTGYPKLVAFGNQRRKVDFAKEAEVEAEAR